MPVTDSGSSAVTSTCRASASASSVKAWRRASGSASITRPPAASASSSSAALAAPGLLQRDHVEQDLGVGHRLRDVGQRGVAGVGAVGEDQHRTLSLGARHVDRGQHPVVEVGLGRELELVDHGPGLVAVLGGYDGAGDVAREGHDADVDVVRDGVEEGQGCRLGCLEPLAVHGLADVDRQNRRALDLGRRGGQGGLGRRVLAVDRGRHLVQVHLRPGRDRDQDLDAVIGRLDVGDRRLLGR